MLMEDRMLVAWMPMTAANVTALLGEHHAGREGHERTLVLVAFLSLCL